MFLDHRMGRILQLARSRSLRKFSHTLMADPVANKTQNEVWSFDGGYDIAGAFALSHETASDQLAVLMGPVETTLKRAKNGAEIAAVNVAKREFQKEYMERWNATSEITGTGRPIDAIISPVAPFPAARPARFTYYNYTTWVNLFDYTSCVVPVTTADKSVDVVDEAFKPLSDEDKKVMADCKSIPSLFSQTRTCPRLLPTG